jgi:hypothetical protein
VSHRIAALIACLHLLSTPAQEKEVGYALHKKAVLPYGSDTPVNAVVFCSSPLLVLEKDVYPSALYLGNLQQGALKNALNPDYCAWLCSIEPASQSDLLTHAYSATPADLLAKMTSVLVLSLLTWALIH